MSFFFFDEAQDTDEYRAFVDKFKPKKTTDDCYTPQNIYDAVADWVAAEYGVNRVCFARPFWPGGDYQAYKYIPDAVVVDNPPFSILTQIVQWYQAREIPFFLFAPTLTMLTRVEGVCHIAVGVQVIYENGAQVNTSFVTNLEPDTMLRSAPGLYKAIDAVNDENWHRQHRRMPKYVYPNHVITAAIAYHYSQYGIDYRVDRRNCVRISALDEQKAKGVKSGIFGGGLLLSAAAAAERAAAERAAAERAAAERAAVERWKLSPREWEIVKKLGGD